MRPMKFRNIISLVTPFILISSFLATQSILAQDINLGKKVFSECVACHSVEPNVHLVGPSLAGVLNRNIGSAPDYRFSKALKNSNGVWDKKTLNSFIENPQAIFPGNRMPYSGLNNATERSALIAYLETLKP